MDSGVCIQGQPKILSWNLNSVDFIYSAVISQTNQYQKLNSQNKFKRMHEEGISCCKFLSKEKKKGIKQPTFRSTLIKKKEQKQNKQLPVIIFKIKQ